MRLVIPATVSRTILLALLVSSGTAQGATAFDEQFRPFFAANCNDCHADGADEGGLELAELGTDLDDPQTMAAWIRIYDRVRTGEMPPDEADQPSDEDRAAFVKLLKKPLVEAHAARKGTVLRRLNRQEYENTLNDMFGTNLKLAGMLPEDGRSHEFENVGKALSISMVQLQRYLEAADLVLDASIAKATEKPTSKITRASYADTREGEKFIGTKWLKLDDGAVVFFSSGGYPSGMLRDANVRESGRYKVRVTGYAFQSDEPVTFSVGATTFARGAEKPTFGYFSFPPGEPTTVELEAWIESRYMIQIEPWGISDRNYEIKKNGIKNYQGPGLAILHVELEGPLTDEFPSRGHRLIFEGLSRKEVEPANPAVKKKPWYEPEFKVISDDPAADILPVLKRVASRAFRRPASDAQVARYADLFQSELEKGISFEQALRTAVAAILCSPDFLFLREKAGWLDDYALASRLSYFLSRTLPDAELLDAARLGKLSTDRATFAEQTERLLNHKHSSRFVEDFTDAWLNLRDIEFTSPDRNLFPEFDPFLQFSMLAETRGYFRELLDENLSVSNIVKSDFAMLNNRLAQHYGIEGVGSPEIRRVRLPADSQRGGILSQGSVLKVSANGTNTSPVVRGVWVLERILGQAPPPPPAGVPGVEPDIRGATTLRELLDKHRSLITCRSCHEMIDPPGFALESFNPIGGWRERFRSLGEGERVDLQVNGRNVRYKLGPKVDATGQLPDGREFSGFGEFREMLGKDEDALAKAFVTKLLVFATGREMGFSDRDVIDRIVAQSAAKGYGVRDLIHLVVSSEIFRRK